MQNPDPLSADPYTGSRSCKKRPPPKERHSINPTKRPKKLLAETSTEPAQTSAEPARSAYGPSDDLNKDTGTQTSPKKASVNQKNALTNPTLIKCECCGHHNKPSKTELKLMAKDNFIQTIQHNDATCFHYTGIPKVALLLQLFCWLEPSAKKSKTVGWQ